VISADTPLCSTLRSQKSLVLWWASYPGGPSV
jgi:hypothetical protein